MVFVILAVDDDVVGDPDGAWALTEDHGGETRTFVLKPLPNKDITV